MINPRGAPWAKKIGVLRKEFWATAALLLLLFSGPKHALAENADVQIDVTTSEVDTSEAINPLLNPPPPSGAEIKNFALQPPPGPNYFWALVQFPYGYNSNPTLASSDINESWHFDPAIKLALKQQLGPMQLNVSSAFDIDRYSSNSGANAETWLSSIKLNFKPFGQFTPYLQYQPALKYDEDYSVLKSETNDLGGGVDYKLPPGAIWKLVDIDASVLRRYSLTVDSTAVAIKPTFSYVSGNKLWRFLFQPTFRVRWYDEAAGISRTDETIIAPAILEFDPPWLDFGDFVGDIELSAIYTHNFSNIATVRASQWIVGPVLEFGWSHSWPKNPLVPNL
jgi:hypothetical protein